MQGLDKPTLKAGLIKLQKDMIQKVEPDYEYYAEQLATLIENFVKSGKVTVQKGISVSTTGSAYAQTGKTIETGTGTIS